MRLREHDRGLHGRPGPAAVCPDCLELVAEDLDEDNEHCGRTASTSNSEISARNGGSSGGASSARPLPALREARMVMYSNLASQHAIRQAIQAASCSG